MKANKAYDIHIFKLSNKEHEYAFDVDAGFFEMFENTPIDTGKGKVLVALEKTDSHIAMVFNIDVVLELVCDRSLDVFEHKVASERKVWFKYGAAYEEQSEELVVIPGDAQIINIAHYMYEFILLEVPMKKLHPKFSDSENDMEEEDELVYSSLEGEEPEEDDLEENEENEAVDPRWEKLISIKNKNK